MAARTDVRTDAGLASHLAGTDPGEAGWDAEFARALAVLRDPGAAGAGTF
ncbi:hypothetical protein [Actinopolymorpha rutila]|uniref:Uncharacterized protein n=1 Tax=Actinopolymorpha rutila TaxID=446787 RepID=A0A852Z2C4_9ACTN|nr:hypothetical protein [Actinopolymorpha rutila]NYH87577.1 hypothetical protein [Actinopolymorpha rutila]